MKVQFAIQGGGAKLITLLAAASAIQDCQAKNLISLSRVIGTSAGAITGALLAAGVDINGFRHELSAGVNTRIISSLCKPSKFRWFKAALAGTPLWETAVLRQILEDVFQRRSKELQKPLSTLGDLLKATGVELRVVCADLRSPHPVVYKPDGNDKEIITALLDSAGIPIYFRTWNHGSLVDGGLVQNFPWDELTESRTISHGPILGLSFGSDAKNIAENRSEYASALLNTALDSATERARARLGSDRVLTLPSEFDTFDFEKALSDESLGNHFDLVKIQTTRWIESRVRNSGILIVDDPWKSTSISVMEKLGRMYETQHEHTLLKYADLQIQIWAYTLLQNGEPDIVQYSIAFNTTNRDVYCHSVGLSQASKDSGSFKQSEITLIGPDQKLIPAEYLPIVDRATPENREIVLFFERVLPAGTGPYTLTIRDVVQGLMGDLLRDRKDVLYTRCPRTDQTVDRVRAILHCPPNCSNVHMIESEELRGKQVLGRSVSQVELRAFQSPGPGWTTLGWQGENVKPLEFFGPSIRL